MFLMEAKPRQYRGISERELMKRLRERERAEGIVRTVALVKEPILSIAASIATARKVNKQDVLSAVLAAGLTRIAEGSDERFERYLEIVMAGRKNKKQTELNLNLEPKTAA